MMASAISFFGGLPASPLMSAVDAADGSSTGIAMGQISVVIQELRSSLFGTFQPVADLPIYGSYCVKTRHRPTVNRPAPIHE